MSRKFISKFSYFEFRYDFLYIYYGRQLNEFATLTGQFTELSSNSFQSTGEHLLIIFQSDESETRTGFNLTFNTGK